MRAVMLAAAVLVSGAAGPVGRVTGVGGVFFQSSNPKALTAWYHDVLGIELAPWGGAVMPLDAPGHPPALIWNAFPRGSKYFAPSTRDVMINYAVDDMDAMLARLAAHNVKILKQDSDTTGRFAWIVDPDGVKVELWQPPKK